MIKVGFFDLGTGALPPKKGGKRLQGCLGCKLDRTCKSPKMDVFGKGKKQILLINEYPGPSDDKNNEPLCGEAGALLEKILDSLELDFEEDFWAVNAVRCRPPHKKIPSDQEISECRTKLLKTITDLKPKVIIAFGTIAIKGLIQPRISGRLKKVKAKDFYNYAIPDQDLKTWIFPTYDPNYLIRNNDKVLRAIFKKQIKLAVKHADIPLKTVRTAVNTTEDISIAIKWLKMAYTRAVNVSFDYETTGIKPHREGHEIVCASIAFQDRELKKFQAFAFPMFKDEIFQKWWKRLMMGSRKVGKIAHNASFEATWTKSKCGYWPQNWEWDTCLGAHCLNSKQKTSLKFHVFTEFGVIGYDDSVDKYITSKKHGEDEKSANSFNQVYKAPFKQLMEYCAMDSLYTLHLYHIQKKQFNKHTQIGMDFFMKGMKALAEVQYNGMRIDTELLELYWKRVTKKIDRALNKLKEFPEWKKWTGKSEINVNSDTQMSKFLYTILGYKIPEGCEDRKNSASALEKIGTDFTTAILPYRKLLKIRDTYMAQFKREEVNGIIRGFYNLHIPSTFRSSSDKPNLQNQPKRGPDADMIRDLVVPRKGNRLLEYDYKAVEVSMSACVHKDPTMIKYLKDPSTDMHRDMTCEIVLYKPEDVDKKVRGIIKNTFVFPTFYGSSTKPEEGKEIGNITRNIWEDLPDYAIKHLKSKGIKNIRKFQKHMENVEWKFWNERFHVYNEWKRQMYDEYKKKGYVELLTGFRCYGPLKFTEATNYPIQGPAFHILLNTLINSHKKVSEISSQSTIIGQVHDCLIIDAHPDDEKEIDKIIYDEGIVKPMKKWNWITVPLQIEKERSEINGSWSEMKGCGYITKGE